jgi:hypothetical protein
MVQYNINVSIFRKNIILMFLFHGVTYYMMMRLSVKDSPKLSAVSQHDLLNG